MYMESLDSIVNALNELGKTSLFDIISLFISVSSLIFAILVPVRIANRQDKISLFEKRLNTYLELMKLVQFSDWLKNQNMENDQVIEELAISERMRCIVSQFCQSFNCDMPIVDFDDVFDKCIIPTIERNKIIVDTIPFLYGRQFKSKREQVAKELACSYKYLIEFMKEICAGHNDETNKNALTKTVEVFMQKYKTTLITLLKM